MLNRHRSPRHDLRNPWPGAARLALAMWMVTAVLVPRLSFTSLGAEETAHQRFALWDEGVPFPRREDLSYPPGATDVMVHRRALLVIAVSRPGQKAFSKMWKIRDGACQALGSGPEWSYPCAIEFDRILYVVYTSEKHHCVLTTIPVKSLLKGPLP